MSKKLFQKLIKRASTPVPKEQDKQLHPEDFQAALDKTPAAKSFYETLNKTNAYAILFRIHMAKKPETRQARIEKFIGMLERSEKLY
jgi:uncharacterized protein YdeI (YjbR/CyaY-like superfamily)